MIVNTIIFTLISLLLFLFSDYFSKQISKKIFPKHYKKIKDIEKRMKDLKNLIRLTIIHNDKESYYKLQREYSELYNSIFFLKIFLYLTFFIPILVFASIMNFFYKYTELILPPINLLIFLLGIYFIIKMIISFYKNFK